MFLHTVRGVGGLLVPPVFSGLPVEGPSVLIGLLTESPLGPQEPLLGGATKNKISSGESDPDE